MTVRCHVNWPVGQTDHKIYPSHGRTPSYLEKMYEEFPDDIICADGNFIFDQSHLTNLENVNGIIVPVRRLPHVPLTEEAEEFNRGLGHVRSVVERGFLLKNKFKRLETKQVFQYEWHTLIHHYATACSLSNISKSISPENLNRFSNPSYFEIADIVNEPQEIQGVGTIYALRAQIVNNYRVSAGRSTRARAAPVEEESITVRRTEAPTQVSQSSSSVSRSVRVPETVPSEQQPHTLTPIAALQRSSRSQQANISRGREFQNITSGQELDRRSRPIIAPNRTNL